MMQMGLLAGRKKEAKCQRQKKNEKISHFPHVPDCPITTTRTTTTPATSMSSITYFHGDLFSAPEGAILAHSCNCIGSWGGGIALQFKKRFPRAHKAYVDHCKAHAAAPEALLGTCLLLEDTAENSGAVFRIACLFTSVGNSSSLARIKRSPQDVIIRATQESMTDLGRQADEGVTISMPQINAGLFCVPWEETEAVLRGFPGPFHVYVFP